MATGFKTGRNDICPCGSGLKYKNCCLKGKAPFTGKDVAAEYYKKHRIRLKKPEDIAGMRKAGELAMQLLDAVEELIQPGTETDEINRLVHDMTIRHGATPAPLHYRGFPKSVCVSVNDVICHGIPGKRILEDGDIVNVDVTPILGGYYADVNKTYFVGTPGSDARKIVDVARTCLAKAIQVVKPGNTVGDIGWVIQDYAEDMGCSVVREFVGHGVGLDFHEAPEIPHYGRRGRGIRLVEGMTFTIEPMVNLGRRDLVVLEDGWTAVTQDGSFSAQFEQTLLVTREGCESLTPFDLGDY